MKLWKVTAISLTGEAWYRYRVEGYNLETRESFCWAVPNVDDDRYDLSDVSVPSLPQRQTSTAASAMEATHAQNRRDQPT
jgi:hypothetical protein